MDRFGVREICNIVFRPLADITLAGTKFKAGQPCLWVDTAKTSSLEGAATTVYAQGGRGNARLVAWEGEKTLTFTFEDALISATSFAMLSGADLAQVTATDETYVHSTFDVVCEEANKVVVPVASTDIVVNNLLPAYAVIQNSAGGVKQYLPKALQYTAPQSASTTTTFVYVPTVAADAPDQIKVGDIVRVDCYVKKTTGKIITIAQDNFGGYFYVEAETLFRDEETGTDIPAIFIIPRCKIQSNFTFTMAATGDPSTFTFTMDAFPGYTKPDQAAGGEAKKVLAMIQVMDEEALSEDAYSHYDVDQSHENGDSTKPMPAQGA